jgi:hypothetical protein
MQHFQENHRVFVTAHPERAVCPERFEGLPGMGLRHVHRSPLSLNDWTLG